MSCVCSLTEKLTVVSVLHTTYIQSGEKVTGDLLRTPTGQSRPFDDTTGSELQAGERDDLPLRTEANHLDERGTKAFEVRVGGETGN